MAVWKLSLSQPTRLIGAAPLPLPAHTSAGADVMRRAVVIALIALMMTAAACTTATSPPPPGPSITASSTTPTAAVPPTTARPSGARTGSQQQRPASTSISLSQPPGTYTVPQYGLCGQRFGVFEGGELEVYPEVPKMVTSGPDVGIRFLVVALGADCRYGATVSVSPAGAAKVTSMVSADDGKPLVVMVVPESGKTGVVTFTPAGGAPVRTTIG